MSLQLVTFGGLRAINDSGELERLLAQRSRAALLVYLAVERRASRDRVTAIFWPESDAANARHALRQSLYHLRKAIGADWIDSGAHELAVSEHVRTDANDFSDAVQRGDAESAMLLYRGPFLHGVHLADLKGWESWVDSRRAQYARTFRKVCRELLDARRGAGDHAGAIAIGEHWTARDPLDEEAQHRLIEALAAGGERAEAIRQYETYARTLEPDGLTPLDETERLVRQLRSELPPLPALSPAAPVPRSDRTESEPVSTRSAAPARMRLIPIGATLLVVILLSIWALRDRRSARSRASSTTTIAVLPFSVGGDESVQYLGEGIVSLLATALDGAGSVRPADTRATFAAVTESRGRGSAAELGNRVASRLGAAMYVLGDVVEAGGMLHIDAAVYEAGAPCTTTVERMTASGECAAEQPLTKAAVSGETERAFELVDRLAAQLLGGLGDPAADRLVQTAAMTTSSLPAFKAYLQGEAMMRAGEFERAAETYLGAIALDSTFAVAHYRLALAREWAPLPGEEDAARAAARHGERLSARDRMLLQAFRLWRTGDATAAAQAYRTVLARYPDDVDAWFQLGEIQFHHGPLVGHPVAESEEAWRSVLAREPRNLFALAHLARIAIATGRSATLDSLLARYEPEQLRHDRRLAELTILRAVGRGDTATARGIARELLRQESFAVWRVAVFLTAFAPDAAMMRRVIDQLSVDYPNAALRSDLRWFASILELARGRAQSARLALDEAIAAERAAPAADRRWAFDAVTQWFVATLPLPFEDSVLRRDRERAASAHLDSTPPGAPFASVLGTGLPIRLEPLRQYTLGILSARLADDVSASAAAQRLRRFAASHDATPLVRDLDRGLRAFLAHRAGHQEDALRLLESLEYGDSQGDIAVTPFVSRANERFLYGEVLVALGRDAEALRWYASLGVGSVTEVPLLAVSLLRQGEIHVRLGDREGADHDFAQSLRIWRDADPSFRALADGVRRRLPLVRAR